MNFVYFPISYIDYFFSETWHHADYWGHPPEFKNIWLEGKSRLDGVALAIIKDDLPALTSSSDTKSVFESATLIFKNLRDIIFLSLRFLGFLKNSHFILETPRIS